MNPIYVREGDLFLVNSESCLAGAICLVEKIKSLDNSATYNHAGIILDSKGTTLEALWRIDHADLNAYKGRKILIVRHCGMNNDRFTKGIESVMKYHGKLYPVFRLFLHLVGLAKYIHWTYPVCSELVGRFLYGAGLFKSTGWGWNPDNLADFFIDNKAYDTVAQVDEFPGVG